MQQLPVAGQDVMRLTRVEAILAAELATKPGVGVVAIAVREVEQETDTGVA